jgi:dienelactone hydrolase
MMRRKLTVCFAILLCFTLVKISLGDAREDFLKIIDRPRVPLAPKVAEIPRMGPLNQYIPQDNFSYASDAQQRVPGILLKSSNSQGRRPVVIAMHGTGGSKVNEMPFLRKLAAAGFIAIAIDGRYHGERSAAGNGTVDYENAIVKAWREAGTNGKPTEHPLYFDTVWDIMRLIDYLQSRDDVDPNRIGLYGVSKGGIEAYLAAAMDKRVAVAVPCIGLESFKWALDNNDWQVRISTFQNAFNVVAKDAGVEEPGTEFVRQFYARVIPGIDGEFAGPEMTKLICPRPLMAINGDSDAHTPLPGLQICIDTAKAAYHNAGAEDHFIARIQKNTEHQVRPDSEAAAIDWFVKWLKP